MNGTADRPRFQMVKLEERLAPTATVIHIDVSEGTGVNGDHLHIVVTPSGNVNGHFKINGDNAPFHAH
jgi:hypothetical protein